MRSETLTIRVPGYSLKHGIRPDTSLNVQARIANWVHSGRAITSAGEWLQHESDGMLRVTVGCALEFHAITYNDAACNFV